jgi:hypothetical protein
MIKTYIGAKFYKLVEEGMEVIRIIKYNKKYHNFLYYDEVAYRNSGNITKNIISEDELQKDYTYVIPDIILSFNIVNSYFNDNKIKDIIILASTKESDKDCILCRQMFIDLYALCINCKSIDTFNRLGFCITKDSAISLSPNKDEKSYDNFKVHYGLLSSIMVNVYLNDVIDDMLPIFLKYKYDSMNHLLKTLSNKFPNYYIYNNIPELLKGTGFMYELDKMFKIYTVPFKIEDCKLLNAQLHYLENEISHTINNMLIIDYDDDINTNLIEVDYLIIRDSDNKLYLLTYQQGNIIIDKEVMSNEELLKFTSIKK